MSLLRFGRLPMPRILQPLCHDVDDANNIASAKPFKPCAATMIFLHSLLADVDLLKLLGHTTRAGAHLQRSSNRRRDVLPLPPLCLPLHGDEFEVVVARLVNITILGLNHLYSCPGYSNDIPNVQANVHAMLSARVRDLCVHVDSPHRVTSPLDALEQLCGSAAGPIGSKPVPSSESCRLHADTIDLLEHSGAVDPLPFLGDRARQIISSLTSLFPPGLKPLRGFRNIAPGDRAEYIKLVAKQLLAKKVDGAYSVAAGGVVSGRIFLQKTYLIIKKLSYSHCQARIHRLAPHNNYQVMKKNMKI